MSVIKVHNHGSIAISRNTGFAQAQGEWIAFLDSDDYWAANKLMVCSKFFTSEPDLIYHDLKILNEILPSRANRAINSRQVKSPVFFDLLFKGNTIATSSVIVRKSVLSKVGGMSEDPEMAGVEDFNTWLKISKVTDRFQHIKMDLGTYRLHGTNISDIARHSPPWTAVAEFLPTLSEKERVGLDLHFTYVSARLKFLAGFYGESRMELKKVVRSLKIEYVSKALLMNGFGIFLSIWKRYGGK
jgi:glycosyltransferase involved in cell wall biosynthesis